MLPLSCQQAAGVRTPANQKSTVLLSCWWRGGFQGALFHNATLSNIKNTKGNKTEQGWSTRWIQQWRWFLKMSLKTIITDAVTLSFATKRTTAEAQYTVIRCKQEKSALLGKSIIDQYKQLKRNWRSDKVQGGSGSIHVPNLAFWNLIQMFGNISTILSNPLIFWSFCLSYLYCLQVYSWQDSSSEKIHAFLTWTRPSQQLLISALGFLFTGTLSWVPVSCEAFCKLSDTDLLDISGNKRHSVPTRVPINQNWTERAQ